MTADILKAMVQAAGSVQCDEQVKLKCADVTFNAEGMVAEIESSK